MSEEASADYPTRKGLFCGWDVARSRDLSVLWFTEVVGDVSWCRGVITMHNVPTPDQLNQGRALLKAGIIGRMAIDKMGMGLTIFETLEREFPSRVEGVEFSQATKQVMAVQLKRRMEEHKVRLPNDATVRASFRAVKRSVNALGQLRFDAAHDEKFGHADHFWACALAETLADEGMGTVSMFVIGKPRPEERMPVQQNFRAARF